MYRITQQYIETVNLQGLYLGLLLVALVGLFYVAWLDKDDMITDAGRRLYVATLVISALLFCPASAWLIVTKLAAGSLGISQIMRMLPLVPVIALAFTAFSDYATKKPSWPVIYGVSAVLIIVLCGSIIPYSTGLSVKSNFVSKEERQAYAELTDIVAAIEEYTDKENEKRMREYEESTGKDILAGERDTVKLFTPVVLAPSEILGEIRIVSGNVQVLYGRDMWFPVVARGLQNAGEYPENLRILFGLTEALSGVTAEKAEDVLMVTDAGGASKPVALSDVIVSAANHIRAAETNILILPASAAENEAISSAFGGKLWLKTEHYYVYLP